MEQGRLSRRLQQRLGIGLLGLGLLGLTGEVAWATTVGRIPSPPSNPWWLFGPLSGWSWQVLGEWSIGLCFTLLVLGVVLAPPWLQAGWSWEPLRQIGHSSYSVYLWHFPLVLWFSLAFPPSEAGASLRFLVVSLLVVGLVGAGSYTGIEQPFLRARRSVAPTAFPSATRTVRQVEQRSGPGHRGPLKYTTMYGSRLLLGAVLVRSTTPLHWLRLEPRLHQLLVGPALPQRLGQLRRPLDGGSGFL